MTPDFSVFTFLNNLAGRSNTLDGLIVFLGAYLPYLLVLVFLVLVWRERVTLREKIEMATLPIVAALVTRFGVVSFIRYFYHRPRPFVDHQVNQLIAETSSSFPSGHATFFFTLSTVIFYYNKRWGTVFLIASALVSMARVAAGVHYPSDILAGATIGAVVGAFFVWLSKKVFSKETVAKI